MVEFDRHPDTGYLNVTRLAESAALTDINAPTELYTGQTGHITGYATNTGNVNLTLTVDLINYDTGQVVASMGPVLTTPYSPYFSFDLAFTMPSGDFHWYISLHN